jgi:hypothetical protein
LLVLHSSYTIGKRGTQHPQLVHPQAVRIVIHLSKLSARVARHTPDGAIWYTSQNAVVRITPSGGVTKFEQLPGWFTTINGLGCVSPIIGASNSVPATGAILALLLPDLPLPGVYGEPDPRRPRQRPKRNRLVHPRGDRRRLYPANLTPTIGCPAPEGANQRAQRFGKAARAR